MSDPTKKKKNKSNAASRKGGNKKKKNATDSNENDNDAWWMKPNYMSLQNLVEHAWRFGPLLNLWDGGGMGEKSIQPFKALIKKGVREAQTFFGGVMEKSYKLRQLKSFEKKFSGAYTEECDVAAHPDDQVQYYLDDKGNL